MRMAQNRAWRAIWAGGGDGPMDGVLVGDWVGCMVGAPLCVQVPHVLGQRVCMMGAMPSYLLLGPLVQNFLRESFPDMSMTPHF